jgi:molecular chaperone DnaJ
MAPQREWFEKDYYAALGVSKEASAKEITRAYRKLAREFHPDANPGDAAAEARFKEVSAAYDVVGDEAKRREYDEVRAMGPMGGFGGSGGFGPGMGGMGATGGQFDMGSLFGGLFRQAGGRNGPRRGKDVHAEMTLSFEEAAFGMETTIPLVVDAVCPTCSGSGARPGTSPRTCESCGGRGVQAENQGPFSFSRPCVSCGGHCRVVDDPCGTCRGSGTERRARDVRVRIPAGVEDGQHVRIKGRGRPGRGGPAGDLYVVVAVTPHRAFGRRGADLTLTVPVTWPEAVLGAEVRVPTLDGDPVTLKVPAGTPTGRTLRVKGRGVAARRGPGDLLVTIEVHVPEATTEGERAAVEAVEAALDTSGGDLRSGLTG